MAGLTHRSDVLTAGPHQGLTFDMHCHTRGRDTPEDIINNGLSGGFLALVADLPLLIRSETGIIPDGTFKKGRPGRSLKAS